MARRTCAENCCRILVVQVLLGLSLHAFSDEGNAEEAGNSEELNTILVEPRTTSPLRSDGNGTGGFLFEQEYLDRFGELDGGLKGVLELVPNLQFGDQALGPGAVSDVRPQSYSISGGRSYENQILLDGMSISNRIDPVADTGAAIGEVPGHEQARFIDSSLIGNVQVFDSNVPAQYGGFTGGVVEMETRRAGSDPEAEVSYSTNRSDWAEYRTFTRDFDPSEGGLPPVPPDEPAFERERINANYSTPVGDASGVVLGVSQSDSTDPVVSLGESRAQRQVNRNVTTNFSTVMPDEESLVDVGLTYAPYRHERLIADVRGSDYTVRGGGLGLNASLETLGTTVTHTWELGVDYTENSRRAPKDFFNWANTKSRNWGRRADVGSSRAGGYGDLDQYQAGATVKWHAETMPKPWGGVDVKHNYGASYGHSRYGYERPEALYIYQNPVINTSVQCRGNQYDCVQNEQYFSTRQVYPAEDVIVDLNKTAAFGETTFDFGRLTATAGLRYSYDDFLDNHNVGYRSRATYDVFDNRRTVVRAGINRYYGAPLLTYKLREAREPYHAEFRGTQRNVVGDWKRDAGQGEFRYLFGDLATPYSDERTIGLEQALFEGRVRLQYVERDNRNEFARRTLPRQADGFRRRKITNDGKSDYHSISISYFAEIGRTLLNASATHSETTTSNATYDDPVDDTAPAQFVFLDDQRVRYREIDIRRNDYARPWILNLGLTHRFQGGVSLTLNNRYRGSYRKIVSTGEVREGKPVENDSGGSVREQLEVYESSERPSTLITDLKFSYQHGFGGHHNLTAEMQVSNLFNRRTHTVPDGQSGVEIGRYYWVGLRYGF